MQIRPDPSLTAPTPEPQLQGDTWRDVGEGWLQCRASIEQCNADKAAIRGDEIPSSTKNDKAPPSGTNK